jgi:hypothetical protein
MNIQLILHVVAGCFIYNIIIKAIGNMIFKRIFGKDEDEFTSVIRKTFDERLKEKQEQKANHE